MRHWQNYTDGRSAHTVVGTLLERKGVRSPQLANRRSLYVYLPPSYQESDRRYPVIYMHDGQNLFDQELSYAGEWQVDETMEALSHEGLEAIVVGIPNKSRRRLDEYSPFRDDRLNSGGSGEAYMAFLVETVKPLIDRDFRTLSGRRHTGIVGSSMGGLISLYGFFRHPEVFGMAGAMSPSFWFAQGAIFPFVEAAPFAPGKIHLDIGTYEGPDMRDGRAQLPTYVGRYILSLRRMRELLIEKGYRADADISYEEAPEAVHHEASWAHRLPGVLRFLLSDARPQGDGRAQTQPAQLPEMVY
jgi:predicted alpha/beta superfamily hydrolase